MARRATGSATQQAPLEETQTVADEMSQEHISGRGWHGDPEGHAAAGRKGGRKVSENRDHMAEIGRRGGSKVAQDRSHMAEIGRRGGAKVSQDRSHMAEIGKKGGESR
jgi:general stress protein YciG